MAKERVDSYIKTLGIIATILISVGIAREQITRNQDDIKVGRSDTKFLGEKVHKLEIDQANLENTTKATLNTLISINASLKSLESSSNLQGTTIALIQKDISNLEVAE